MMRCPTNTCRGETRPSTAISVNQTLTISADSRCVYTVRDAAWVKPTSTMRILVSNANMSNTQTSLSSTQYTLLTGETKVQPNQFVMVINTGSTGVQFNTYDDPINIPIETISAGTSLGISIFSLIIMCLIFYY